MIQFNTDNPIQNDQCPICLEEDGEDWVSHEANTSEIDKKVQHVSHKECLKGVLVKNMDSESKCPLCRDVIDLNSLFSQEEIKEFNDGGLDCLKIVARDFNGSAILPSMLCAAISFFATIALEQKFEATLSGKVIASAITAGALSRVLRFRPLLTGVVDITLPSTVNAIYLASVSTISAEYLPALEPLDLPNLSPLLVPPIYCFAARHFPGVFPFVARSNPEGMLIGFSPLHFLLPFVIHFALQDFTSS